MPPKKQIARLTQLARSWRPQPGMGDDLCRPETCSWHPSPYPAWPDTSPSTLIALRRSSGLRCEAVDQRITTPASRMPPKLSVICHH